MVNAQSTMDTFLACASRTVMLIPHPIVYNRREQDLR